MTQTETNLGAHGCSLDSDVPERPLKRLKYESNSTRPLAAEESPLAAPSHPLGIKPSGNAYIATEDLRTRMGALALLSDEVLLDLLGYFDAPSLLRVGACCKALYAFARVEDLWKCLLIE
jgi:hypothetical protein